MKIKCLYSLLIIVALILPYTTHAWNSTNHRLVAQIAADNLKPQVRVEVHRMLQTLAKQYPGNQNMLNASVLLDKLKYKGIKTYNHWHYVDFPYNPLHLHVRPLPKKNAIWAIFNAYEYVSQPNVKPSKRAFYLSVLLHVVGDIHQPMHCISLYDKQFPNGDLGGNRYKIRTQFAKNLHSYWDAALYFYLPEQNSATQSTRTYLRYPQIRALAKQLQRKYPIKRWRKAIAKMDPNTWAHESFELARKYAYNTPYGQRPSLKYQRRGKQIAERRIVLAGYRLAALLNNLI